MKPYLWILISGFAFSWMAALAHLTGRACGWQTVAIVRCAVPLLLLLIWSKWDGVKLTLWGSPYLWVRSLAGSCSLVGTFYAFNHLPLTEIYTIANTFPVWVALLSWPMLGQMPTGLVWLSIASSIVGVFVLQGPQLQDGNPAALVVVAVSVLTAIAMMGLNQLKHLDPRAVVVHFSATALVFATAALCVFPMEAAKEIFNWTHAVELSLVGVTATIGQYFLTRAFTAGDPAKVSVASLSQFVMIFVLDTTVLGHSIEISKLWGIPLILGPTIWLMTRRIKSSALAPESESRDEPAGDLAICADAVGPADSKQNTIRRR